jgi:hypothetical protein
LVPPLHLLVPPRHPLLLINPLHLPRLLRPLRNPSVIIFVHRFL